MNVTDITVSNAAYTAAASASASGSTKDTASAAETETTEVGAVYEKSDETSSKGIYSINKMSSEERAALVSQLQADQETRKSQLTEIVSQLISKQGNAFALASDDDVWKFLASGDFEVDEATKAQAQEDISEDGYWGVKQTSQRMFDFASALAGDDVDKMKEMQEAMMKGFEQATQTWGKELPQISQDTIDAANKLFEDYYASKETGTTTA